ncbi:MAG: glycosyltransferase family 4 protein [Hyphomicrobiaceae bacterium]
MRKLAIVNQPLDGVVPPEQTSIGIWTFNVAPHLARHYDVTVYSRWKRSQRSWKRDERLRYHFVRSLPQRVVGSLKPAIARLKDQNLPVVASRLHYLDYALAVALQLRRRGVDIVHIHNFTQFVPIVRTFNPRAKLVLHMAGEWLTQLDARIMGERAEMCDLILGASDHITNLIRARFPRLAHRCHTVYNGVDVEKFSPPAVVRPRDEPKRLLFVGRVSPEKGVHVLLEALPTIAEKYPGVHLDIVGAVGAMPAEHLVSLSDDRDVRGLLSLYAEPYGTYLGRLIPRALANQVNFMGNLPHDALVDQYRRADLLINPSYSESFGMSLVEALACETPVVATKVGGMVEIITDDSLGMLVDRGDVSGLAQAILTLLDDDERRTVMGKAGREMVLKRFSWSQIGERVNRLYAGMTDANG